MLKKFRQSSMFIPRSRAESIISFNSHSSLIMPVDLARKPNFLNTYKRSSDEKPIMRDIVNVIGNILSGADSIFKCKHLS